MYLWLRSLFVPSIGSKSKMEKIQNNLEISRTFQKFSVFAFANDSCISKKGHHELFLILFDSSCFERYGTIRTIKSTNLQERSKNATLHKVDQLEVSFVV